MAQHLRIANTGIVGRAPGDWADTETACDILRSLEMVREAEQPAMTMIAGSPGVGKTQAVKQYCSQLGHDGIYIQAARGEGTAWNFAKLLAGIFGGPQVIKFNTLAEARMLLSRYIGHRRLLVVDEAQYLHQKNGKTNQVGEAFEWLRATADMGKFDVVFCGDLNLISAVNAMPQLQSRMLRPVIVKEACRADVAAIVEGTAFANGKAIDALHHVARMKGGLRNVGNVTRIALLFAGSDHPTLAHLKAAIIDMKLAPKGGVQ